MSPETPVVFALGATGPAGVCLLRELAFRNYHAVIYARNPAKIPKDLAENALFQIVKGEMDDKEAVKDAMAPCSAVLSLLGPSITQKDIHPSLYADYYKRTVFPAMRELNIRRIIAMGTISLSRPDDRWTILQPMVRGLMRLFAGNLFKNMLNLEHAFEEDGRGLDWTVFRIAAIPGESDDESWRRDRESCQVYSGCVGGKGWTTSIPRAALARWIVDNVAAEEWYAKIPAVSILAS